MAKNEDSKAWIKVGGGFALFIVVAWIATPHVLSHFITSDTIANSYALRGQFGDQYGSINALFSGLAFVGVIVAIMLQKEELEEQRRELKLTREAFEEQNEVLNIQRFENTFFNMVSLHNDIVNSLRLGESERRGVFNWIYSDFERAWEIVSNSNSPNFERTCFQQFEKRQNIFGHYFRNLFRIIKFVDESNVEDKKFYTDIIRAQLSNRELLLLFYNSFFYEPGKGFQKYIIKYELLDNMPKEPLLSPEHVTVIPNSPHSAS